MRALLPLLLLCGAGCIGVSKQMVRDQASFDLRCPKEQIEVTMGADQRSAEVVACGQRARYRDVADQGASWVRVGTP